MSQPASMATAAAAPAARARHGRGGRAALDWTLQNVVWFWLVALVAIFGGLNAFFLSIANLQNILLQATVLGLLALAVSLPLLVAEIDLSIAANLGFSSVVGALLVTKAHLPGRSAPRRASRSAPRSASSTGSASRGFRWCH